MLEVGYAGGLRVSELVGLKWADVVTRAEGRVQLSVTGKGERLRDVLLPAIVSRSLLASRGEAADRMRPCSGAARVEPRSTLARSIA